MYRRLAAAALALFTGTAIALVGSPAQSAPIVLPTIIDDETLSCTELVPHAVSVDTVPVVLDLRILLDGAPLDEAEKAVVAMRKAYEPLGISVAPSYQAVSFGGVDAALLNQQAKDLYGGGRPAGIDVVYTMTSKDITAAGSPLGDNVAGLADCIGGVRYADHAFAVGEIFPGTTGSLLGLIPLPLRDGTGKTMGHEVGHLMGGHHHYTSPEGVLAEDANVADLMGPVLSIVSLKLSTLNSLMVRAHAQLYAMP
jgi:hypothetical protein